MLLRSAAFAKVQFSHGKPGKLVQHSPRFSGWDARLHNWASPSESWLRFQTCLCGISQIPIGKERLVVSLVTDRAPLAEAREFGRARAEHALAKGNPLITHCSIPNIAFIGAHDVTHTDIFQT